jgi:hypothetical protein
VFAVDLKVVRRLPPPQSAVASPAHLLEQSLSGAATEPVLKPSPQ